MQYFKSHLPGVTEYPRAFRLHSLIFQMPTLHGTALWCLRHPQAQPAQSPPLCPSQLLQNWQKALVNCHCDTRVQNPSNPKTRWFLISTLQRDTAVPAKEGRSPASGRPQEVRLSWAVSYLAQSTVFSPQLCPRYYMFVCSHCMLYCEKYYIYFQQVFFLNVQTATHGESSLEWLL